MNIEYTIKLRKIGRWVTGTWIMQIVYNVIKQMYFSTQFFSFPDYKDYIQQQNLRFSFKYFNYVLICIFSHEVFEIYLVVLTRAQ